MDLFKMMKQMGELKSKAGDIESRLKGRKIEIKAEGIYILANAKKDILDLRIDETIYQGGRERLQAKLLKALKQTLEESQKALVEEVKNGLGGMDMGLLNNILKS